MWGTSASGYGSSGAAQQGAYGDVNLYEGIMSDKVKLGNIKAVSRTGAAPTKPTGLATVGPPLEKIVQTAEIGLALNLVSTAELRQQFRLLFQLPPHMADLLFLLLEVQARQRPGRYPLPPNAEAWLAELASPQLPRVLGLDMVQGLTLAQLSQAIEKMSRMLLNNQSVMQRGMGSDMQHLFELVQWLQNRTLQAPITSVDTLLTLYCPKLDPFHGHERLGVLWLPWQGQQPPAAAQPIVPLSQGKGDGQAADPDDSTPPAQQWVIYLQTYHLGRFRVSFALVPRVAGQAGAGYQCAVICQHEPERFNKEEHRPQLLEAVKEALPKSLWPTLALQWATMPGGPLTSAAERPLAASAQGDAWQQQRYGDANKANVPTQGVDALIMIHAQAFTTAILNLDERLGVREQRAQRQGKG
jgi:hypothetical protein